MTRNEALQQIRAMGLTAKSTGFGDIVVRFKTCINKKDHGTFVETWEDALSTAREMQWAGAHCCDQIAGRVPTK